MFGCILGALLGFERFLGFVNIFLDFVGALYNLGPKIIVVSFMYLGHKKNRFYRYFVWVKIFIVHKNK